MPYAVILGVNTAGTKFVTIPAPPANLQQTFIDSIYMGIFSASAGVQGGSGRVSIPTNAGIGQLGLDIGVVAGSGVGGLGQIVFPNGGLLVSTSSSALGCSADAVPSGAYTIMDIVIGFHHG